ncbi:hypothetical protein BV22DRAFT_1022762, partial [Leucogyrophana mollusca]
QAYLASETDKNSTTIIVDSGATSHIVPHYSWFELRTYKLLFLLRPVTFRDESTVCAIKTGTVVLHTSLGNKDPNIVLSNVLPIPKVQKNKSHILKALHKCRLYYMKAIPKVSPKSALATVNINPLHYWMGQIRNITDEFCEPCVLGKLWGLSFRDPLGGGCAGQLVQVVHVSPPEKVSLIG